MNPPPTNHPFMINPPMINPPMKRHESLQPLSRDHYAGLVQARRLRIAADKPKSQRLAAIKEFFDEWDSLMAEHFDDEERLLTELIAEQAVADRLLQEHEQIRAMAADAARMVEQESSPDPRWMLRLSKKLHEHIRWEERIVFPTIERNATPTQLERLSQVTQEIDQSRPRWERAGRTHTRHT